MEKSSIPDAEKKFSEMLDKFSYLCYCITNLTQ